MLGCLLVPGVCRYLRILLQRLSPLPKILNLDLDALAYGRKVGHSATDMPEDLELLLVGEVEGVAYSNGIRGCRAGHATSFLSAIPALCDALADVVRLRGDPVGASRARKGCVNTSSVAPFRGASRFFADAVAAVPVERYEIRWSTDWRILDLIGHGNRANVLPVEYYERPVGIAPPEYGLPERIAERARQAVSALGDDPVGAVRTASERALAMVAAAPDDATVGTPFGELSLDSYLRSRIAELVLHGLDLGTTVEPPAGAVVECGAFLISRAVQNGCGIDVVRALSGRGNLPPDFTVY